MSDSDPSADPHDWNTRDGGLAALNVACAFWWGNLLTPPVAPPTLVPFPNANANTNGGDDEE